ncbi:MAG TPA: SapB/AmfS family lanthipeptide [Pseudonocardiaceae bacterium]|jgi:hypothetical protein
MNVLDLQEMDAPEYLDGHGGGHGGGGGGSISGLSLLLCDSAASVIACL